MIPSSVDICIDSASDSALISLLRQYRCELIVGRTGRLSVFVVDGESVPMAAYVTSLIREAFRRKSRLTPYARVNSIRLREEGLLVSAA